MGMENFGKKSEVVPEVPVEKKEVGIENIDGDIDAEAQKLDKAVEDINNELESVGGQEGLEKIIDQLTPEQQAKVRQSIQYRFESLKGRLAGYSITGAVAGATGMAVVNEFHNIFSLSEKQDWGIKEMAIGAGIGAVIASWGTLKRLFSEYQNNKYIEKGEFDYETVHGQRSHSGRRVYEYSNRAGELHPRTQAEKDKDRIKFLIGQEQAWSSRQNMGHADWDTPKYILEGREELEKLRNKKYE